MNKLENFWDNASKTMYSSESYDVILALNMLHTVPNPQDVMQRINEILNPDGLFISVTTCLGQKDVIFS
jgi:2-polyprenyl-3-methyl-5-hydroxy-6-metoxy-1,4-benzoquinol methylase